VGVLFILLSSSLYTHSEVAKFGQHASTQCDCSVGWMPAANDCCVLLGFRRVFQMIPYCIIKVTFSYLINCNTLSN
jgi:hypothetical protein